MKYTLSYQTGDYPLDRWSPVSFSGTYHHIRILAFWCATHPSESRFAILDRHDYSNRWSRHTKVNVLFESKADSVEFALTFDVGAVAQILDKSGFYAYLAKSSARFCGTIDNSLLDLVYLFRIFCVEHGSCVNIHNTEEFATQAL